MRWVAVWWEGGGATSDAGPSVLNSPGGQGGTAVTPVLGGMWVTALGGRAMAEWRRSRDDGL